MSDFVEAARSHLEVDEIGGIINEEQMAEHRAVYPECRVCLADKNNFMDEFERRITWH